ncbi:MAG TPA: nuclear transport factor 2 family protein [Beijerinckiaceae bacterium]|nr:nuclear transport factor 2 family protein [Beijerinckiaceae bacterium]
MKHIGWAVALLMIAVTSAASAQSARLPRNVESAATQDVLAVRDKIRNAVAGKNRSALEALYSDDFVHLRDSGRVEIKGDRISLLLSGEPTIEVAPEESVDVRLFGPTTAIATGVSLIRDPQVRKNVPFRWLTVYVKQGDAWQVAASQASRLVRGGR